MASSKEGRTSGKERRSELVQIAYRHIAERGFEGLRLGDVAREAGINNATLVYYFPTKEALIQGVVDYLLREFSTTRPPPLNEAPGSAVDQIRAEFEDARRRLHESPEQFVVFTELLVRSLRDPTVALVFHRLDENWHSHLAAVIQQGVQEGVFRQELDPAITATALMAQIKGIGFQMMGEASVAAADKVLAHIAAQVEYWLTGQARHEPR